jgi:hypothetical protein
MSARLPTSPKHDTVLQYGTLGEAKPYNQWITRGFFLMDPESAAPFAAATAGFGLLLIVLAYAVRRERLIYRSIVSVIAILATVMTTLSYAQLASTREPAVMLARAEPMPPKSLVPPTICVRRGVAPACNCVVQR